MSNPSSYTIGWICAITIEYVAAQIFLDETHQPPEILSEHDNTNYTLGRIGKHNVVIAVLPDGEYGMSSAATVARDLVRSFPNVRIGLMVGVGGGAGSGVRLGDVVVSSPRDGHGGVFQYDFGKSIQDQVFKTTGFLNQPPAVLRTALNGLKAEIHRKGPCLDEMVSAALSTEPRLRKTCVRPPIETDRLFRSDVVHDGVCCDTEPNPEFLVLRKARGEDEDNPAVHYGLIASANQLMKNAHTRDKLTEEQGVLCFEMEAAGLMNHFPCVIIRGICDCSDSHKNKNWQGYAAMTSAAYGKKLIGHVQQARLDGEKRIAETMSMEIQHTTQTVSELKAQIAVDKLGRLSVAEEAIHDAHHNQHEPMCHPKTRIDLLKDIQHWWTAPRDWHIYWLSGSAGTGKSTISRTVSASLSHQDLLAATFFFKRGVASCNTASSFFSTIARQLARNRPDVLPFLVDAIHKTRDISSKGILLQYKELILGPLENLFIDKYKEIFKETYRETYRSVYYQVYAESAPRSFVWTALHKKALENDTQTTFEVVFEHAKQTALSLGHGWAEDKEARQPISGTNLETTESIGKETRSLFEKAAERALRNTARSEDEADVLATEKAIEAAYNQAANVADNKTYRYSTLFLVIDALDECSAAEDIDTLVPLLSQLTKSKICNIKIFLTSRPEIAIRYKLQPVPGVYKNILHKVAPDIINQDIKFFLEDELVAMRESWNARIGSTHLQRLKKTWPGKSSVAALVELANGLFIFAATTCRFLADPYASPHEQLTLLLNSVQQSGINDRLSPIYLPVLWQLKKGVHTRDEDAVLSRFKRVVGAIILLEQPLPVDAMADLLGISVMQIERILDPLISVIDIPETRTSPVVPFHLSFRDFLLGPDARDFSIDYKETHRKLARDCFDLINDGQRLHYNMCGLKLSSTRRDASPAVVARQFPPHVRYACCHWVYHFSQGGVRIKVGDEVEQFICNHLLHWIEALSIFGRVKEAANMADNLLSLVDGPIDCQLKVLLHDARYFVLENLSVFDHPLQIYWSGLIFAPNESSIRKTFIHQILSFESRILGDRSWGSLPILLSNEQSSHVCAAVSPDSRMLATCTHSGLLELWKLPDMTLLSRTEILQHQANKLHVPTTIVFYSNASGVILATPTHLYSHGIETYRTLWVSRLGSTVEHLAVSQKRDILASSNQNHTVTLWSSLEGTRLKTLSATLPEEKPPWRGSVAFLDTATVIVAIFSTNIYVWDFETSSLLSEFHQFSPIISPIIPVPDSFLLLVHRQTGEIDTFDIRSGESKAATNTVFSNFFLAFSGDARLIASKSFDGDILFHSLDHPEFSHVIPPYPHNGFTTGSWDSTMMLFSKDGRFLIDVHQSSTQVWAIPPYHNFVAQHEERRFHNRGKFAASRCCVQESTEGDMFLSYHDGQGLKVWSTKTGQCVRILRFPGGLHLPWNITVSPNMEYAFESAGWGTRRIWPLSKPNEVIKIEDSPFPALPPISGLSFSHGRWTAKFSPDSKYFIACSSHEVSLWTVKGEMIFYDRPFCSGPVQASADWKLVEYHVKRPRLPGLMGLLACMEKIIERKVLWTEKRRTIAFPERVTESMVLTTSPDLEWIASLRHDSSHYVATIWSLSGGVQLFLDERLVLRSSKTVLSSGQRHTACINRDGTVLVQSLSTNRGYVVSVGYETDKWQIVFHESRREMPATGETTPNRKSPSAVDLEEILVESTESQNAHYSEK